jgi:hypothetical protein
MRRLIVGIFLVVSIGLVGHSIGQPDDLPQIRCHWNAPDTGSPVHHYELHVWDVDTNDPDTTFIVPAQPGTEQEFTFEGQWYWHLAARVRGVDAQGRAGPWSGMSQDYQPQPPEPSFD